MKDIKGLISQNSILFILLGVALVADAVNLIPGSGSGSGSGSRSGPLSFLVVSYFFGSAMLIRLLIVRKRLSSIAVWPVIIVLYFGWFILMAAMGDAQAYKPSLLFILSLIASYTTLRFQPAANIVTNDQTDET
jgi:hypothetical protein